MIDSHLVDVHEATAHNPTAWYYCAETLLESADHIRLGLEAADRHKLLERAGYMDTHYLTYGLLLGYAIECILKGIWVKNGNTLVEDGRLKKNAIPDAGEHELGQIAHSIGANVLGDELNVLHRLSAFIQFAGRYPIPVRASDLQSRNVPGRGKVHPGFFSLDDFRIAREMATRLIAEISGWPRRLE